MKMTPEALMLRAQEIANQHQNIDTGVTFMQSAGMAATAVGLFIGNIVVAKVACAAALGAFAVGVGNGIVAGYRCGQLSKEINKDEVTDDVVHPDGYAAPVVG